MNPPTPVDPDKLRARLAQAVEPVTPSPDALIQIRAAVRRRRRLQWSIGSGASVLAVAGVTAAVVAIGSLGRPSAAPRTVAPGYSRTVTATTVSPPPITTTPPVVVPSASPQPLVTTRAVASQPAAVAVPTTADARTTGAPVTTLGGAATTGTTTTATVPTGAGATPTSAGPALPAQHDLDRDGKADVVRTEFLNAKTARLVMTTAGRTVRSASFPLSEGMGAGTITYVQITGSAGRSEVLVKDPGADHTTYLLYQYAGGRLQAVPAPPGAPHWITTGGGGIAPTSFGCPGGDLTLNEARPTSMQKYLAGTDKTYIFESFGYVFTYGGTTLKHFSGYGTAFLLTRSQAMSRLATAPNGSCGAS